MGIVRVVLSNKPLHPTVAAYTQVFNSTSHLPVRRRASSFGGGLVCKCAVASA